MAHHDTDPRHTLPVMWEDVRFVRVSVGRRKKAWVLARIIHDEDYNPTDYQIVDMPLGCVDLEDWMDVKEMLARCYFHYPQYEVYRGKLREVKR